MKKNDLQEIKGLNIKAITEKIKVVKQEISTLILDKNMSKLKDLKSISKKRKDVAQMMTVVRQKQLLEELTDKKEEKEEPKTVEKTIDKKKKEKAKW